MPGRSQRLLKYFEDNMKDGKATEWTQFSKCFIFSIRQVYFIYLFYLIILQTFTPIWTENEYMGAPSRKKGTPTMRILTPFIPKRSKK